jgi:hypothetical protein
MLLLHALGRATARPGLAGGARRRPALPLKLHCAIYDLCRAAPERRAGGLPDRVQGASLAWTLQVDARVLDPRPDTETLVEWALALLAGQAMARGRPGHRQRRHCAGAAKPAACMPSDMPWTPAPTRWTWPAPTPAPGPARDLPPGLMAGPLAMQQSIRPDRLQPALRGRSRPAPGRPAARTAAGAGVRPRRPGRHPPDHPAGARLAWRPAAGCCWNMATTKPTPCVVFILVTAAIAFTFIVAGPPWLGHYIGVQDVVIFGFSTMWAPFAYVAAALALPLAAWLNHRRTSQ